MLWLQFKCSYPDLDPSKQKRNVLGLHRLCNAFRTSYNNLTSRSGPYWSLYPMDCAIENTPSFSNISVKMNFASSNCSATISMSNSLSWLYFLRCRSKKMISKDESVNYFVELLTDINEIGIIHTNLSPM